MRASLAVLLALSPVAAAAQDERPCELVFTGVARGPDTTFMKVFTTAAGARNTFIGGGVDATCEGQGNRLLADSAEYYADRGQLILIERVRYSEPRMTMQSDRMVYFTREERLLSTGNVRGRTASGTRFSGPQMEYFRAKPGLRAVPSWRAPGRPSVRMAPTDAQPTDAAPRTPGAPSDSVDLTADLILSPNDSLVVAVGRVVVDRHDLHATADSATLDQFSGFARLMRTPVIVGRGDRPFTLVGRVVDLWSRDRRLERVRSSGEAKVESDSLTLTGDSIDLRLSDQRMQRVFVWGGRAKADAPAQQMEADSLDILMPGQQLRELHAVGHAIAWSGVDTSRIMSDERDWIAGDTLVARFEPVSPTDSGAGARMREMVATGAARSFYQIAGSSGAKAPPSLSYNRGREIQVSFTSGEVERVEVRDRASGLLLEPTPTDTTANAATPGANPAAKSAVKPEAKPPVRRP